MFEFSDPFYFFLFLPWLLALWAVYRRRITAATAFSGLARLPQHRRTWRTTLTPVLPLLYMTGAALTIIALARPRTVFSQTIRRTNAVAIEMVVDVSGSMRATDLSIGRNQRTRLDVVKETFAAFIDQRPDDLIGLVTFGGFATSRAPLTLDHDALRHVLEAVEVPNPIRNRQGEVLNQEELLTAIGDALATGVARLRPIDVTSRVVVLLSDGESNTGIIEPDEATKAAETLGVRVYTIGVGTSRGDSPIDEAQLRRIADTTGGRYFSVSHPRALQDAMAAIDELEKTEVERETYHHFDELFGWFLFPGLGCVLSGTALSMAIARRVI